MLLSIMWREKSQENNRHQTQIGGVWHEKQYSTHKMHNFKSGLNIGD